MTKEQVTRIEEIENEIEELDVLIDRRTKRFLKKIKEYQTQYDTGEISEETLIKRTQIRLKSLSDLIERVAVHQHELLTEERNYLS